MTAISTLIDDALRSANIPIVGVSVGAPNDRTTWKVQFAPEATAAHQTQAAQIVSTFNPADPATVAANIAAAAAMTSRQKDQLASAARRLALATPAAWNAMTPTQKKTAVLAEADNWRDIRVWIEQNL